MSSRALLCGVLCLNALTIPAAAAAMTWQRVPTSPTDDNLHSVAWGNGLFVAVGEAADMDCTVLTSPNGIDWTLQPQSPGSSTCVDVVWNGSQWVAVGRRNAPTIEPVVLTSSDGTSWTTVLGFGGGDNGGLVAVAWKSGLAPHYFIALGPPFGADQTRKYNSTTGFDWLPGAPVSASGLRTLLWDGSRFLAAGDFGRILTSTEGTFWTPRTSGTTEQLRGGALGGSTYVLVGSTGTILRSTNSIDWTLQSPGAAESLNDAAWNGGIFVAVGENNIIHSSPDGMAWHQQPAPPPLSGQGALLDVVWGGNRWVAVGTSGEILYSDDTTPVELQSFAVE